MTARKVDNVDVVAYAGAIGGGVVVAEHLNALQLSNGNLGNVGKQVVWDVLRVFADATGNVRTDGIEVAKQNDVPFAVSAIEIGQNALEHNLGFAVRIGCFVKWAFLGDRDHLGLTVNRRGREKMMFFTPWLRATSKSTSEPATLFQ